MEDQFQTDDILIASYLLTKQAKLLDLICDSQRHFIFLFENSYLCEQLVRDYLNNALAPARELFARREELISQMRHRNGNRNNYGKK